MVFALSSRYDFPLDSSEVLSSLPPCGLSANANASWHVPALNNLSPPSLRQHYPASALLWGDPTSPRASTGRRCLLPVYRYADPQRSPGVRSNNVLPPPPSLLLGHQRISGVALEGTLTQGREARLRVHLRSVLQFGYGFLPTRPHGIDFDCPMSKLRLVQLLSPRGYLR